MDGVNERQHVVDWGLRKYAMAKVENMSRTSRSLVEYSTCAAVDFLAIRQ